MTKSELVRRLLESNPSLYQKDVRLIVETVLEEISGALERGDRVELRGFGAFSIRTRKPRVARNPKTNEKVQLGERSVVYFRAGKGLRDRLNDEDTGYEPGDEVEEDQSAGGISPSFSQPAPQPTYQPESPAPQPAEQAPIQQPAPELEPSYSPEPSPFSQPSQPETPESNDSDDEDNDEGGPGGSTPPFGSSY